MAKLYISGLCQASLDLNQSGIHLLLVLSWLENRIILRVKLREQKPLIVFSCVLVNLLLTSMGRANAEFFFFEVYLLLFKILLRKLFALLLLRQYFVSALFAERNLLESTLFARCHWTAIASYDEWFFIGLS